MSGGGGSTQPRGQFRVSTARSLRCKRRAGLAGHTLGRPSAACAFEGVLENKVSPAGFVSRTPFRPRGPFGSAGRLCPVPVGPPHPSCPAQGPPTALGLYFFFFNNGLCFLEAESFQGQLPPSVGRVQSRKGNAVTPLLPRARVSAPWVVVHCGVPHHPSLGTPRLSTSAGPGVGGRDARVFLRFRV